MNEYYAVIRQDNELAHYGVRGMKWGVRKAIHKGTDRAWDKVYKKASKKLKKLDKQANLKEQINENKYHTRKMLSSAAGVFGSLGGAYGISKALNSPHMYFTRTSEGIGVGTGTGLMALGFGLAGKESYHAGKAIAANYRTTDKGHAKAVKKRNEWQKEMDKAFRGTPYDRTRKTKNKSRRVQV